MKHIIITLLLLTSPLAMADWQCSLTDSNNESWQRTAAHKDQAIDVVVDVCRQESSFNWSCQADSTSCQEVKSEATDDALAGEPAPAKLWTCTAADRANLAFRREDSTESLAKARALAACRSRSNKGSSCKVVAGSCEQAKDF